MIKITVKLTSGQVIEEVVSSSSVTIGRSQKSDVVIPDESLSRSHCQLDYDGENFFITDLASANGVSIDGRRLEPNKKTKFSSFQEILVGAHELSVVYEDEISRFSQNSPSQKTRIDDISDLPTKSSRSINKDALNKPFVTKDAAGKKPPKKGFSPLNAVAFLVILGAVYWQFQGKDSEESVSVQSASSNVPAAAATLADEFLKDSEYQSRDEIKSCTGAGETTCKELALKETTEGVLVEEKQSFIYIRPFTHQDEPKFEKIKAFEDKEDLIALYLALRSPAFESFRSKNIFQLHVILKDEKYRPYRVYRFHTKYFSTNGPEKSRLISELITIFDGGGSANFWKEASPIVQKQNL